MIRSKMFVTMTAVSVLVVAHAPVAARARLGLSAQMKHDMKQHGDMAMGFDQDKATHHFTLTPEGGAIQVTARSSKDATTREAIRSHLQEISRAFAEGNFEKPFMTHGEEPAGVAAMKRLKAAISYTYTEVPDGGRVTIATGDPDALNAIHDFLRYQIREHKTGDAGSVGKVK
jgi:hypothetical protein